VAEYLTLLSSTQIQSISRDSFSAQVTLENGDAWRRFDSMSTGAITDFINRLFSNDIMPVRLARRTGLTLVNNAPPLKRFFMWHAMGYWAIYRR